MSIRSVAAAAGAALILLAAPTSAWAEPSLSITGLRQEAGLVEFYLSGQDLPAGTALDQITVRAGDQQLQVTVEPVKVGQVAAVPRRAVVLVVDTSGSMEGAAIAAARASARKYVDRLPADVQIGVVSAGAPARIVLKPTANRAAARRAIDGLATAGETALYDGLREGVKLISDDSWEQRRIVLLSDGADTASKTSLQQARDAAAAKQIAVDTIAFQTEDATAQVLAGIAAGTAGRSYTAADAAALETAFVGAAGSFSAQLLVQVTVPAELGGKPAKLAVTAGGISTDRELTFAVDTSAADPLAGVDAPSLGLVGLLVVGGLIFAALLAVALLVVSPALSAAGKRRRLDQLQQFTAVPHRPAAAPQVSNSVQLTQAALALSAQVVKSTNAEGRIAIQLDRAGMRLRPHEWLLIRGIVGLVLALLLGVLLGPVAGLLLGPLLGVLLTSLYHRNRAGKRMRTFEETLPDALQLIIGSLRSGFSLSQSIDAVIRELPDPISTEFGRALGETRLGEDLEDALDRVAERMGSKDLAWAVVAIRVQREVGGNLAEVLATTVETMRERDSLRRHVKSLSAEGVLSAWVLLGLPIGVGGFMFVFRTEYVAPLYTEPLGILMSVIAVILMAVGSFWLSRLVKVEV